MAVFGRRIFCVTHLTVFFLLLVDLCHAYVKILDKDGNEIVAFDSAQASFGMELPKKGLSGWAVQIIPEDGCHKIQPPPQKNKSE